MIKHFQPTQYLLLTVGNQGDNLMRAQKSVSVNKPDNLAVAFCKLDWGNCGSPFETRGSFIWHPCRLPRVKKTM